jgi:hypothetical protein
MSEQEKLIEDALKHVYFIPGWNIHQIKEKEAYYGKLAELAEANLDGFDKSGQNDNHRLTKQTVMSELDTILRKVKHRKRTSDDVDVISEFSELKNRHWSELLGQGYSTYTIVFPLHIREHGPYTDRFETSGKAMVNIPYETWHTEYLETAIDEDERYLTELLSKIPSDFRFDGYSFWKIEYEANDAAYAFEHIRSVLRLILAKLVFVQHYKLVSKPRSISRDKIPRDRWSALREPPLYLIFRSSNYIDFFASPIQYTKSEGTNDFPKTVQHFRDLPNPSIKRNDPDDVETRLVNALLSHHDGMTESTIQDSFLSFWRGIEILAGYDSPHKEIGPKALFVYKYVFKTSYLGSELEDFVDEIAQKRGDFVHRRVDLEISEREQRYAKILLDALLEFYFVTHKISTKDDYKTILKYGALDDDEKDI